MSRIILAAIRIYRTLGSPYFGQSCRFCPTCSEYAEEALKKHGVVKGTVLVLWRIMRCNPWGGSGYDPVP